jgi:hypothetical protein
VNAPYGFAIPSIETTLLPRLTVRCEPVAAHSPWGVGSGLEHPALPVPDEALAAVVEPRSLPAVAPADLTGCGRGVEVVYERCRWPVPLWQVFVSPQKSLPGGADTSPCAGTTTLLPWRGEPSEYALDHEVNAGHDRRRRGRNLRGGFGRRSWTHSTPTWRPAAACRRRDERRLPSMEGDGHGVRQGTCSTRGVQRDPRGRLVWLMNADLERDNDTKCVRAVRVNES